MTSRWDRRTFLQGTSAAALSTMFPLDPYVKPASAQEMTANFNGGRSQVNVSHLQAGGGFPFLNCLKTAQVWSVIGGDNGRPDPTTLDSNGYPISLTYGGVVTVFFVPSQNARPGNYVITWSGNGTIWLGMPHTLVTGSKVSTNGRGRFVFSTTVDRFVVGISAIGNPHITNLQVFHVNDEPDLAAGKVFGQKFLARLRQANFGVIRFISWEPGGNVTTWATRKPASYVYYAGQEFRGSLYAGVTTNVGAAYAARLPGFVLADKATVIAKLNASNNGPCTLNVNETGDINIVGAYGRVLSSGGNSYPVGGTWQSIATFVYDATLHAWIKFGGDVGMGSAGLLNGCPPELMVQLCAEVGAHPHFTTPMLAIDPATDYIPQLAAYCRDRGPSWMIPRFEGPNETWNSAAGFLQTGYAVEKSKAYGWGADYHNWYGKIMSVLGQAVGAAYGGDRTKYQVLCGVQTATGSSVGSTASSNDRLASTKYLVQSTPPQSPYTKSPAFEWVTHICCAQYYSPSEYGTPQEASDAARYVAGSPSERALIAAAYASTANNGDGPFTLSKCLIFYRNWKAWAQKFGINKMCGYEGGYSPDFNSGGVSQLDQLRAASKLAAVLEDFTTINYNNFVGLSDDGFIAEFPSIFLLSGPAPCNNAWSALDDIYQAPDPPQWKAIVAFNATKDRPSHGRQN